MVTSENSYLLKIEIEELELMMPSYIMDTAGHAMGMAGTRILYQKRISNTIL